MSKGSDDVAKGLGGLVFFIIFLIALIPKEIWIAIGVGVALTLVIVLFVWGINAYEKQGGGGSKGRSRKGGAGGCRQTRARR
ncbi:hypothetical protein [Mycolicibacterium sp. 120270]|uniref:hypothetical protein n=1 Tax=Mycolicibacterium sp. 120270 TaxID=3090600 RepID=UPI00299D1210|nr:hypothetical protein [Mycolicibacterium sp. 120270]MDX1887797.1 hypothetical protein [Mycolicibacterium sp. 120270]